MSIETLVLGILVFVGGVIGYRKAASLPSLIMGSLFGSLLIVCGVAMQLSGASWAINTALATTLCLLLLFAYRLRSTGKKMPAVPMIVMSSAWLALYVVRIALGWG